MAKILTDEIIPELKGKVLPNTDGSVKPNNIDWDIQRIFFTYVSPKIVNNQLYMFKYGKLLMVTGSFQVNGNFAYTETLLEYSDTNVVRALRDNGWIVSSNKIYWGGADTSWNNSWQSISVFGFLL